MNNPSPTTMKECSCPHPHDYCDFKETICQPSEEKCTCHYSGKTLTNTVYCKMHGTKPNSTTLEWEEQIRGLATDSGPGDKDEIIKIVKELLSFQQEEILNDLLKNGYGGGNYRRLILDKLSRRV